MNTCGVSPLSRSFLALLLFLFPLTLFLSCANPIPPSGGPRDETPPSVRQSQPTDGAVNVDRESVVITFSEYIDRGSFAQALTVTPQFERELEIDWGGREVEIEFPAALRDTTTYILTLDTNLRDNHGVQLNAPITIAFATGPTINRGRISGTVRGAPNGAGQEGVDVYAYAARAVPDSLPEQPDYRTQTGQDGTFTFEYLREQPYFVIALRDNNRNRRPDPAEAFAAPPTPLVSADSQATTGPAPWILAATDTIPPTLNRVQPLSDRRVALRFNEPVRLADEMPDSWMLRDSVRSERIPIEARYQRPGEGTALRLRTGPMRPTVHRLMLPAGAVVDTAGNALPADTARFVALSESDTLQTRFRAFTPTGLTPDTTGLYTLWPDDTPGVRFNQPVDTSALRNRLTALQPDTTARPFALSSPDGLTYQLAFTPPLDAGQTLTLRLDGALIDRPDTTFSRRLQRLPDRMRGSLSGAIAWADTSAADTSAAAPFVVEVIMTGSERFTPQRIEADTSGAFTFTDLPEGTFRFRAFADRDGDGRWDPGQLLPYRPPEPLVWSAGTIDNRPRWDNVLEDTLRIPNAARR